MLGTALFTPGLLDAPHGVGRAPGQQQRSPAIDGGPGRRFLVPNPTPIAVVGVASAPPVTVAIT